MKKPSKLKILTILLLLGGSRESFADIQCVGHYISDQVSYQQSNVGDAFNKFSANLSGTWPTAVDGILSQYKSWRRFTSGTTAYSIGIPKTVNLNVFGQQYPITLNPINAFTIPTNSSWQAFKVNETFEGCHKASTGGLWVQQTAGLRGGQVNFNVQGRPLPSGNFNIKVPYILAWGSSPGGDNSDYLTKRTWDYVGTNNVTGYFNVNMVIRNRCNISTLNIELDHGRLLPNQVQGHEVRKPLSITCDETSTIKFTFSDAAPINSGIKSTMKILNNNTEVNQLQGKKFDVDVVSVLENMNSSGVIKEGSFSMHTVLMVEYV